MHANLLESDEIDAHLYPALLQVFVIVFIGYLAGTFALIDKAQAQGLNKFVSTFALPALLFKMIVSVDLSTVDWTYLASIFLAKSFMFVMAILVTLVTIRPVNVGLAGIFAIYVSQSNDFALGAPIINAVYSKTHPDYINYIYIIAPISLCILNPIAFCMMEANEVVMKRKSKNDRRLPYAEEELDSGVLEKVSTDEEDPEKGLLQRKNQKSEASANLNEISPVTDSQATESSSFCSTDEALRQNKFVRDFIQN